MIVVAFQVKKKNLFFKAFLLLYICAFLMGGILQWLFPYLRTGSVFFAAAVLAYFLVNGIWKFVSTLSSKQQKMYRVTLFMGAWKQEVLAWLDTGNGLKDPLTGQPVHVLDPSAAEEFMKDRALEGVRYIPFRTIQGEGVMPAIRIEKMCIQTLPDKTKVFKADSKEKQTEIWVNKPVIGISRERIFAREDYQMLLNPEGLGGI